MLVAALVAAAHWPVLRAQAIALDDTVFVSDNTLVRHPGWDSVRRFFTEVLDPSSVSAYYLPVSMTSLMLDVALGGRPDDQRAFHVSNLALHVLNSVLMLLLLYRLTGALVPAVIAALLFGLHPLTVEPTASIGERKTLLATCFALASLLCYVRWCRRRGWGAFAASVGLFLVALLSKPSVTTLPLLMLLLDLWPLRRLSWRAVLEKWPFLLLAAASGAVTVLAVARTWEFGALPETSVARTALQVCYLIGFYLGKIAWPANLSCVYAPPASFSLSDPAVLAGALVVAAVTVATVVLARRTWGPLAGWAFFVVALVPTFGILRWSTVIAYDRYVYFPALGLALLLAATLGVLWRAPRPMGRALRAILLALALVAAAAEARATRLTAGRWRDSVSLWRHIARVAPGVPDALNGLGVALETRGAQDAAIAEFRRAIAVGPNYADAHFNLGVCLAATGRLDEGIRELEWAAAHEPRSAGVAVQAGIALQAAGRLDEAAQHYARALALRPGHVVAIEQLGLLRVAQGRRDEGIALLRSALELAPDDARPRFGLAVALRETGGREDDVRGLLREAVRMDPDWSAPFNELAWLLATSPDRAVRDTAEALRLADHAVALTSGRSAVVLDTQAAARAAAGRFPGAVESARRALALAEGGHADSLAGVIRARLALFERGLPYVEPPRAAADTGRGRDPR